jgi:hypothetical protein
MRPVWCGLLVFSACFGQAKDDIMGRAMKDEIERAKTLSLSDLGSPYFVEYAVEDVNSYSISATLGALYGENRNRFRVPRVRVRVGDINFDNANYVLSDYYSGDG